MAVMVSGGGTNFQALIDAVESGAIEDARIVLAVSSRADAFALERAKAHGIPAFVAGRAEFPGEGERALAIAAALRGAGAELVVLAGYMSVLPPALVREFSGRIINVHPSLIPKYCGRGFYGMRVHRAVIEAGDAESGATVHFVDEGVDTGPIIIQERVPVPDGGADALAAKVLEAEHRILVKAVGMARPLLPQA
ncbi:MAG: phosphoribosylglycinamide formyltransferase [Clostridiales Family XIII bacterium]|jgi:phosphoribosylglycinamide formyltransferase-1|nr:phosphoribosylglycinamide formyltransferase [Clostridiales Family XIII bacterium]